MIVKILKYAIILIMISSSVNAYAEIDEEAFKNDISNIPPSQTNALLLSDEIVGNGDLVLINNSGFSTSSRLNVSGNLTQNLLKIQSGEVTVGGTVNSDVILDIAGSGISTNLAVNSIIGDVEMHDFSILNVNTISGNIDIRGGEVSGLESIDGNFNMNGGVLNLSITGDKPEDYRYLNIEGTASFSGGLINIDFGDYKPMIGDSWEILFAKGGLTGLDNLSFIGKSTAYPSYQTLVFEIYPSNGNSVIYTLAAVPETNTIAMLFMGLVFLALFYIEEKV